MSNTLSQPSPSPSALRGFFGVLWSPSAWRRTLFLALSFPLGLAWFVVLTTGVSLGLGLAITVIGLPLLAGMLCAWRGFSAVERSAANVLIGVDIAPAPLVCGTPGSGAWPRLKATLGDSLTWRGLAYLLLRFPMGLASFVLLVTGFAFVGALLVAPFLWRGGNMQFGAWRVDTLPEALVLSLAGALLLPALLHAFSALAAAWGVIATALLSPAGTRSEPQPQPAPMGYGVAVPPAT